MKIWTSSRTREKKRYAVRMAAGFAGIAALAVVLIATGAVLIHAMDWPTALSLLLLCLAVTVLSLSLISLLCRRVLRDALVFILDDNGRLFAADGRRLVQYSGPLCIRMPPEKWNTVSRKSAGWPERTCFRQAPWKFSTWNASTNARTAACSFASRVMGTAVPAGAPSSLQTATGMKSICCGSLNKDNGALKQQSDRDSGGTNSAAPNDRDGRNQNCGKISERKPGYTLSRYLFLPPMGRTACRMP